MAAKDTKTAFWASSTAGRGSSIKACPSRSGLWSSLLSPFLAFLQKAAPFFILRGRIHGAKKTALQNFSIIVVAEGYPLEGQVVKSDQRDAFGHEQLGGIGNRLAAILKAKTGFEVRVTNPAYMQRGGIPAAYDRYIAIELGERAVDLVHNGRFGRMAAIARNQVIDVELREVTGTRKV